MQILMRLYVCFMTCILDNSSGILKSVPYKQRFVVVLITVIETSKVKNGKNVQ